MKKLDQPFEDDSDFESIFNESYTADEPSFLEQLEMDDELDGLLRNERELHPLCTLFPVLPEEDLEALAMDIKENGLHERITLCTEGKILDGQNRYNACLLAGVEPEFQTYSGDESKIFEWVVSKNIHRRQLTAAQKVILAIEMLPHYREKAKERQKLGTKNKRRNFSASCFTGEAVEECARASGVNARYIRDVDKIASEDPDLFTLMKELSLSVPDVRLLRKLDRKVRDEILERFSPGKKIRRLISDYEAEKQQKEVASVISGFDHNIYHADLDQVGEKLEDGSVSLFFSDPTRSSSSTGHYGKLAELAARKLQDGGYCLVYSKVHPLDQVIEEMKPHLQFGWVFAITYESPRGKSNDSNITHGWKPILAFYKPPEFKAKRPICDCIKRCEKGEKWQKGQVEAEQIICGLTEINDLVVDPICGNGAILLACRATGRKWLGADENEKAVRNSQTRMQMLNNQLKPKSPKKSA